MSRVCGKASIAGRLIAIAALVASCSAASPQDVETAAVEAHSPSTTSPAAATTAKASPRSTEKPAEENIDFRPSCTPVDPSLTELYIGPDWSDGEVRNLELEIDKGTIPGVTSWTPVLLTASEVPEGFKFRWQNGETELLGRSLPPEAGGLLSATDEMVVEYTVDRDGSFLGLDNIAELRIDLDDSIATIAELPGVDPAVLTETREMFGNMGDDQFSIVFTEDQKLYHYFDGASVVLGEVVEFDDVLPNAFGGPAFPAISTIEVGSIADDDGCIRIVTTTIPDPDLLGGILQETISTFGENVDEGMFDDVEIINQMTIQVDGVTGRIVTLEFVQRVSAPGESSVASKTIVDVTER